MGLHALWVLIGGTLALASSTRHFIEPQNISYAKAPGFNASADPALNRREWKVPASLTPPAGLRLRWTGVAGFEIGDDDTTILIDPFVSRVGALKLLTDQNIQIDPAAVDKYILGGLDLRKVKVILTSHAHHDHVLDVPYILSRWPKAADRPLLVGEPNLKALVAGYANKKDFPWLSGVDRLDHTPMEIIEFNKSEKYHPSILEPLGRDVGQFGKFHVTAFIADHDIYDFSPLQFQGDMKGKAPFRGTEYLTHLDSSIMYLIDYDHGRYRFFAAESVRYLFPERVVGEVGHVNLLLQGITSRKNDDHITEALAGLTPDHLVPTHYDNFSNDLEHMKEFDYQLRMPIFDYSRFKDFLQDFEPHYVAGARVLADDFEGLRVHPQLELLKLFYYYSLEGQLE